MRRLRVIQVGLGEWGRDWAWAVNPTVEEVEIVAYVDSHAAAIELLTGRVPVPEGGAFRSLDEALDSVEADAVLVTTTLPSHAALCREAIEAGRHVLVEKPFAESLAVARELVALAEAKGVVLMVSQNYRWFPAVRAAAQLVAGGELGDLRAVHVDFRRNDFGPPRRRSRLHSDPQPLLVDMSIHHFDLLRLLLRREPDRVLCVTADAGAGGFDGPPTAALTALFGEVLVSYRGSWVSGAPKTPWAGDWSMEFEQGRVFWTSRGDNSAGADRLVATPHGHRPRTLPLPTVARLDRAGALTEFAAAVREGREPETSARDNLATLAFTFAAVESARESRWVAPAAGPGREAPIA